MCTSSDSPSTYCKICLQVLKHDDTQKCLRMVAYQKFGVIGSTVVFAILQKLKFQIFRLFLLYDNCRNSSDCSNSTTYPNNSDVFFEDKDISGFIFKCLIVNNAVAILPCVCLATWSDKHGRKILLIIPFVGSFLGDILMFVLLYIPTVPKDILLLAEALHGFFGGTVLISLGCMCYITDSTDHRLRTWFIGVFIGIFNFLPTIEMILQYYWTPLITQLELKNLILIGVSIRMFFSVYLMIYLKIFVLESVFVLGSYHGNPWANLLTPINVSDTVNCVFKRRLDNMRFFIITLCTVFMFYCLLLYGNIMVYSQHFRDVFEWSYIKIMILSGVFAVSQTFILWIANYVALKCRILDIGLGIYGGLSLALSCLALTFSRSSWVAAAGALLGVASLLIPTSIISVLSKLIERVETGSMYAVIGFIMLVTQLLSVPSYAALNKVCVEAGIPQVIFLLSFGFACFGLMFFIYLQRNIAPDLLGHLNGSESLALLSRKGEIEQLFD